MTLEWTTIDVPLGAGVDTKTNEKLLKPPACADLSDAVFPATGVSGYETRKGYDRIRTDTTISSIDSFATRDNELLVIGNDKLYSVSELENNVDLVEKGQLLAVKVQQDTLDTQAVNQTFGQIITHNGLQVHCWYDSGTSTVQYTVADATTGAIISADNSIAGSNRPKLTRVGSSIQIIYWASATTALRSTVIPTYAPSSTSDVELVSDVDTTGIFDVIETTSALTSSFIAYGQLSVTDNIYSFIIDEAGDVSQTTLVATNTMAALAVGVTDSSFVVVFTEDLGDVYFYESDSGPTIIGTFAEITYNTFSDTETIAYVWDGTNHNIWFSTAGPSADRDNYVRFYQGTTAEIDLDDFDTPVYTLQHSTLSSSGFLAGTEACVHVSYAGALQGTHFLIDTTGTVQAKCCGGVAETTTSPHLPRVIDGTWAPVYREHLDIDVDPDIAEVVTNVFAQKGLKKVSYDFTYRPVFAEYGDATYINSGILWQYDGVELVEQGFHIYPEGITISAANSTGSLAVSTSYSYRVYYEWTNARGERQRSTTATIITESTGASDDTMTLVIPTLAHTNKSTDVSIVVYRSEGDPNLLGGSPFYRISDANPENNTGNNRYVINANSSATVSFVDGMTDALLVVNELDYLNSGELDNITTPSASIMGEAKGRVWMGDFEKENRVMYSKTNARGRDQLEFHDTLWVDIPEAGGKPTAFGALNFHVVVFTENACYAFSGEGRNNLGAGFFNLPQVVSLDVGCIEQRSVVNIPEGIVFKSNKGIWRLGHNLDMKYIGANVEAYNDQDITNATLIPEENHVVFLTSSGRTLVYNYIIGEWTTWTNHAGASAVIWNGTYTYARTDGRIYRQGSNYSDDGVHYAMKFVTAPIGIKGVQGKQKIRHIRLLGEYYSAHTLRVGLRFNHEPGVSDFGTWDPSDGITVSLYGAGAYGAGAYGGSGSPVYQTRFNMPRQKCQTVQFVIDSTNTGGAGRAVSIQAIQIEVGAKRGTGELSVDSSFSATGGSTE